MKTPITQEKIKNHLTYASWKYILLIIVALFGWNLVYSVTEYQPPDEKKVIFGVYAFADEVGINSYMEQVRQTHMPDMEDMSASIIMPDEMYGDMILSTRIAARECDLYLLPRTQFQNYAAQGAFMPLDVVLPDLIAELEAADVSLSRGNRTNDELGEKHQYAIPTAAMTELQNMLLVDISDMYLCMFFETGNNENALKFFDHLVREMLLTQDEAAVQ